MRAGVVVFPGTNCEQDVVHALGMLGVETELVWHRDVDLTGLDGIVLPGGFAHGDYLRTGAIARFSPVMSQVIRLADQGRPVIGICNGFQILCESGLLPGVLIRNRDLRFICRPVEVVVTSSASVLTAAVEVGRVLRLPLNSYEGNYVAGEVVLNELEAEGRIVLRYCNPDGEVVPSANPNGSTRSIAGITSPRGNVAGLMPHPERATDDLLGSADGRLLLEAFASSLIGV